MASSPENPGWFRPARNGALIVLRVTPNAGRDRMEGPAMLADGTQALKVRIAAPPRDGRANDAVIALLAKAAGHPRSAFSVKAGATARTKTILLATSPKEADLARSRIESSFRDK